MHAARTVGLKGQIVIPKDMREYVGIRPGSDVLFEVRGKELILKLRQQPEEFLREFLGGPRLSKPLGARAMKRIIEEQYDLR